MGQPSRLKPQTPKTSLTQSHEPLRGRCDSFVVETHVHFPTDINLLYDAIRKVIEESRTLTEHHTLPGWRQHRHGLQQIKKQYRKIQKLKHSTAKDESKQAKREQDIKQAHQTYLDSIGIYTS